MPQTPNPICVSFAEKNLASNVPQEGVRVQGWESVCWGLGEPLSHIATEPLSHIATLPHRLCSYVPMWLYGCVAMWLCGKFRNFKVPKFRSLKLQSCKVPRFRNSKIPRFHVSKKNEIARFSKFRISTTKNMGTHMLEHLQFLRFSIFQKTCVNGLVCFLYVLSYFYIK